MFTFYFAVDSFSSAFEQLHAFIKASKINKSWTLQHPIYTKYELLLHNAYTPIGSASKYHYLPKPHMVCANCNAMQLWIKHCNYSTLPCNVTIIWSSYYYILCVLFLSDKTFSSVSNRVRIFVIIAETIEHLPWNGEKACHCFICPTGNVLKQSLPHIMHSPLQICTVIN